jgi:hypothetical protein
MPDQFCGISSAAEGLGCVIDASYPNARGVSHPRRLVPVTNNAEPMMAHRGAGATIMVERIRITDAGRMLLEE